MSRGLGSWRRASPAHRQDGLAPRPEPVELPPAWRRYAGARSRWRGGSQVRVLRGGAETFPAQLGAIASAQRSVCLEIYIFEEDAIGRRFIDALCERARAGVEVRLLFDAVGSFGLSATAQDEMREAGVEIVEFHPIAPWRKRWNLSHRDHRKILVVDNEVAFVGGLNIGEEYEAAAAGGGDWHDMHCSLRGAIVLDLARCFRRTWVANGGKDYPAPPRGDSVANVSEPGYARMIDNALRKRRRAIRRAYLDVIHAAQHEVLIKNAYFLPDRELRQALGRAVNRGVEVSVIVPGSSDVRLVEWAGLYVCRQMSKLGVKVLRWGGVMMHAKTAAIDGVWSTIGSYNLDARSLRYNLEITVEVLDAGVGGELARQFHDDATTCEPFTEAVWRAQPWWRRALATLAYRLRGWL